MLLDNVELDSKHTKYFQENMDVKTAICYKTTFCFLDFHPGKIGLSARPH